MRRRAKQLSMVELLDPSHRPTGGERMRINTYLVSIAKSGGCSRCPETFKDCLDFHHRDPKAKKFNIALGLRSNKITPKQMMDEIAKCIVVCSNCHRKLHAEERRKRAAAKERMARQMARDNGPRFDPVKLQPGQPAHNSAPLGLP